MSERWGRGRRPYLTLIAGLALCCLILLGLFVWALVANPVGGPRGATATPSARPSATATPAAVTTPGAAQPPTVVRVPGSGGGASSTVTVKTQPASPPPGTIAAGAVGWTISAAGRDPQAGPYAVAAQLVSLDTPSASAVASPDGTAWLLVRVTLANNGAQPYTPRVGDFTLLDGAGHTVAMPTQNAALVPAGEALPTTAITPGGSASGELLFAAPADAAAPLGLARGLWLGWRPSPGTPAARFAWSIS